MYACRQMCLVYLCVYLFIDIHVQECKFIFVQADMHGHVYMCLCM